MSLSNGTRTMRETEIFYDFINPNFSGLLLSLPPKVEKFTSNTPTGCRRHGERSAHTTRRFDYKVRSISPSFDQAAGHGVHVAS